MTSADVRLLVVDDDDDVREAIRDALTAEGYAIDEARDGREALYYLHTHPPPPLILLDWNMPRMNGPQFMAEVAKDPSLSRIPVLLLTADARAPDKAKIGGVAGYLVKPVALDVLLASINRYCG